MILVVFIMERTSTSLRGHLSRWMIEPRAGVFVGKLSARVREKLWDLMTKKSPSSGFIMIYQNNTEQGFSIKSYGDSSRRVVDLDGIQLIQFPRKD